MVVHAPIKDIGHIPCCTQRARIVLTRTRRPHRRVLDMNLPRGMDEAQDLRRKDWNHIFFVVNVIQVQVLVDVVRESFVSDLCTHGVR